MTRTVQIYDTTLRDGTQAENFNLSVMDKIRISHKLDELGVDFIEGGWPGSNPLAVEFFKAMQDQELKHAKLAAFGSTRLFANPVEKDANLKGLIAAKAPVITIFGKSWDIHVYDALRIELEDNLLIIEESLAYLKPHAEHLFYDAEHFFDGFKKNSEYALATLGKAIDGGAECLILCDTNGGMLPHEVQPIIESVQRFIKERGAVVELGIHAHNDSETAVANSLLALSLGVKQVQGTMNGYGERCGNCNLTSIIPALALKMGYQSKALSNIDKLYDTAMLVDELANLPHNKYQPYVGRSAFAHKGGIHVSAVKRNPLTYEHIDPEKVGNIRRILISDQAGKSNILHKAKKFGIDLDPDSPIAAAIVFELKELENQGFQYEAAEASFELLMRRATGVQPNYFTLKGFRAINSKQKLDLPPETEATVRLEVGGQEVHTASMGDGPVNAIDKAMRKALIQFYPRLEEIELIDYKVRVLSGEHGTGAKVRVLIESKDQHEQWGTVGVSLNIIEASWQALVDSINYKLMRDEQRHAKKH
ncbi:MAG: citramalate synthase [Proteobacteria bacterium]|nr:citramalate synthase [Pseudomonadota bacterium]MBU1232225.1 citramalate synthase [Pseudomonadota bacterium]MBU1417088.1 citramalate synthase [Pseudomonadota bacterium]MBU1453784.1 citramalate synthase [Pseudomonadota bacterium]